MKFNDSSKWLSYSSQKALRITLIYLIISVVWIFGSDKLLSSITEERSTIVLVSIIKGWFFVICTSALIYYLVRNAIAAIQRQGELLKLDEARLKYIFESASDGIFLFNESGDYLDVNSRGCIMLGFSRNEILTKNIKETIVDGPDIMDKLKNTMQGLTSISECRMQKKDGSHLETEISTGNMPDGNFLAIVRDVTERKKYEQQLRESEMRFSTIFRHSPVGIVLSDPDSMKFYEMNDEFLNITGYSRNELVGKSFRDFDFGLAGNVTDRISKLVEEQGELYNFEIRVKNKSGHYQYVLISTRVLEINNKPMHLTLLRNISDRKEIEVETKKTSERYRMLSAHLQTIREEERASIAREMHDELGQILTSLKMSLSLMRREIENKKNHITSADVVNEIEAMNNMIDKAVGRVRKLITQLRPELLDKLGLVPALEWYVQEFSKNTNVDAKFDTELEELSIDNEKTVSIFRIVQEALTNVVKHSEATYVNISLVKAGNKIILEISDNGKGIAPKELNMDNKFGLLGIRERAKLIDGSIQILGRPNKGTSIRLEIVQ